MRVCGYRTPEQREQDLSDCYAGEPYFFARIDNIAPTL